MLSQIMSKHLLRLNKRFWIVSRTFVSAEHIGHIKMLDAGHVTLASLSLGKSIEIYWEKKATCLVPVVVMSAVSDTDDVWTHSPFNKINADNVSSPSEVRVR